jgi:hypothetical protein
MHSVVPMAKSSGDRLDVKSKVILFASSADLAHSTRAIMLNAHIMHGLLRQAPRPLMPDQSQRG